MLAGHFAAVPLVNAVLPVQAAAAAGTGVNPAASGAGAGTNPFAGADEARLSRQAALIASPGSLSPQSAPSSGWTNGANAGATEGQRYLVKFRADCSAESMAAALAGETYKIVGLSQNRLVRLQTNDLPAFRKKAEGLLADVEAEVERKADRAVNDTMAGQQWALGALNLNQAWDITTGSKTFFVAIIDSGVDRSHPDLNDLDIRNGYDYIYGGAVTGDGDGHGTCVTGIMAAETNNGAGMAGVLWSASIIPLRVLNSSGQGTSGDVIEAIYDAADVGCKVINLSLGSHTYSSQEYAAVQYALARGCIVVAAAGNDGTSALSYPASYSGVISVAATTSAYQRASFSNYNSEVDLCAPGENILVTIPYAKYGAYYATGGGTSFAAPYVAGVAALAVALKPGITAAEFLSKAQRTSQDLGSAGYDVYFGSGLIKADKILIAIVNPARFTVSFNSQGGSAVAPVVVDADTKLAIPTSPTRTGYTFGGWYKDAGCTDDWDFANDLVINNMTLFAKWTINQYTVTFKDWNGTELKSEVVNHGGSAIAPPDPFRIGHTFTGWDKPYNNVASNLIVTAQYTVNRHTVTFDSQGGSAVTPVLVDYGTLIPTPAPLPKRTGHGFGGWFKDAALTDDWNFATDVVTGDLTLFAKWVQGQYTVWFRDWDGKDLKIEPVSDGGAATAPADPTRAGHTFTGWDQEFAVVNTDLVVTAQYTINQYTVTFNCYGGSAVAPVVLDYGSKVAQPAAPVKPGYLFFGWFKDEALTDDWDFAVDTVIDNTTIHAKWLLATPENKVRAFVTRFYTLFFDRKPDDGGLNYWTSALVNKTMTGADAAGFFVDSTEFKAMNVNDSTYLDMMYRAFFNREPDDGGKAYWQGYMDNGMSRFWVLWNFVNSGEFQDICTEYGIVRGNLTLTKPADLYPKITAFVTRFYKLTLERMPDEGGLNYWVKDLADKKRTGAILANDFVFSPEFIGRNTTNDQFVAIMYRAFFGREPEAGGFGYWVGELQAGRKTRKDVLAGFVYSSEFQGICNDYGIVRGTLP